MSGIYIFDKYQADYGDGLQVHPIKVQPETLQAVIGGTTNAYTGGAVTNPIKAQVNAGKRNYGLKPRKVRLRFGADAPAGYVPNGTVTIPALSKAFYAKCEVPGATGTYLGKNVTVVGTTRESL